MPYTKTQSNVRPLYIYRANSLPITQQPNQTVSTYTYSKSKTGNYLPNWRRIIRAGGNATTAFNAWIQAVDYNPPKMTIHHDWRINQFNPWVKSYTMSTFGDFFHSDMQPMASHLIPGVSQKAQDRAASRLIKSIHQAHHQLQGGVILGEIDKTARLLTGTAKNLKQGVLKYIGQAVGIRNGRGTKRSKQKAIASSYLEATFGWQPLIHDCRDFAKTLGRLTTEVDRTYIRAVGEWEEQYSQASTEHTFAGLYGNKTVVKKTYARVMYRGFLQGLPYEAGSPALERIVTMSGFDLRSFIPTMWELVPYSFVVDYFTNIGDCLQSWTLDTTPVKALWRTAVTETSTQVYWTLNLPKSMTQISLTLGSNGRNYSGSKEDGRTSTSLYRTVSRDVAAVPLLVPQLTGLDLPWKQFVNLGALITAKSR